MSSWRPSRESRPRWADWPSTSAPRPRRACSCAAPMRPARHGRLRERPRGRARLRTGGGPRGARGNAVSEPAHRFGEGEPFSVGLEEELLLVDPETLQLSHTADQVLERSTLPRERLDHEAFLAEMENRTSPVGSAADAASELREGRAAAAAAGATLLAAGLHPDA